MKTLLHVYRNWHVEVWGDHLLHSLRAGYATDDMESSTRHQHLLYILQY